MERKQKKMKKKSGRKNGEMGEIKTISDDRFVSAQSDPRFMEAPKRRSKVEIDSRFSTLLTNASFTSSNAPVDKRGKPRKNKAIATAPLNHYYHLRRKEDENQVSPLIDEKGHDDILAQSDHIGYAIKTESEKSVESLDDDDDDESSFSSTTDSDSDDQFMDEEEEDTCLQQENNVPETDIETQRLAVVNLDWSHVRAVDLYVLLSSFLPKVGQILSVAVYPSEFGLKRMEEEAIHGPIGLFGNDDDEEHDDDEEDDEIDNKRLRAYELSRLRYYYAVVECDSSDTAGCLYKTCDGVEFERSANKLDLRFIPDSMEFKHQPRDVATEAPADYEGLDFQTNALQQSKILPTWDEDEPQRVKTLKRKLTDEQLAGLELKDILASDESETEDEDNGDGTEDLSVKTCKKRDKYRALFQSEGGSDEEDHCKEDNDQEMEVTFSSGLEDLSKRILEKKDKKSETIWQACLRKREEKKKASKKGSKYSSEDSSSDSDQELAEQPDDFFVEEPSSDTGSKGHPVRSTKKRTHQETYQETEASRAELELLATDDMGADANLKGYNLKPKKSNGKKGKAILDEGKIPTVNYDDPRFSVMFTSPLYALDPTDPQFKRSAAYARQITQKQKIVDKEREQMDGSEIPGEGSMRKGENIASDGLPQRKEKNGLSSLVRSLRMKSNQVRMKSNQVLLSSKHKVSQKYKNLDKAKIRK